MALTRGAGQRVNTIETYPEDIAKVAKVELMQRVDEAARSFGSEIVQVSAGYGDSRKRVLIANSDGVLVNDDIVRLLVRISAVASGDTGSAEPGCRFGNEYAQFVEAEFPAVALLAAKNDRGPVARMTKDVGREADRRIVEELRCREVAGLHQRLRRRPVEFELAESGHRFPECRHVRDRPAVQLAVIGMPLSQHEPVHCACFDAFPWRRP